MTNSPDRSTSPPPSTHGPLPKPEEQRPKSLVDRMRIPKPFLAVLVLVLLVTLPGCGGGGRDGSGPLLQFDDALLASADLEVSFRPRRFVTVEAWLGTERPVSPVAGSFRAAASVDESVRIAYRDVAIDGRDLLSFDNAGLRVHFRGAARKRPSALESRWCGRALARRTPSPEPGWSSNSGLAQARPAVPGSASRRNRRGRRPWARGTPG